MPRYLDGRVFTDVSSSADEEGGDTLGANRWNLVSAHHCLFSTAADPVLHTTGTNQCFLMNYVGSVCETASSLLPWENCFHLGSKIQEKNSLGFLAFENGCVSPLRLVNWLLLNPVSVSKKRPFSR